MRNRRSLTRSPSAARQRGMSLIEIIIVIVLIGAVLAFVGSRVLGGKDRGDYNIAKAQVQTMAGKVESFQMDTGRLPNSLEELVTQPGLLRIPGAGAKFDKIQSLIQAELDLAYIGDKTVADAMAAAAPKVDEELARQG